MATSPKNWLLGSIPFPRLCLYGRRQTWAKFKRAGVDDGGDDGGGIWRKMTKHLLMSLSGPGRGLIHFGTSSDCERDDARDFDAEATLFRNPRPSLKFGLFSDF